MEKTDKLQGRATDHRNLNLTQLQRDVMWGTAGGKILWQPRIGCWYDDRMFRDGKLPEPFTGMEYHELYEYLGCSNRIYDYSRCITAEDPDSVHRYSKILSAAKTEYVIETPAGAIRQIVVSNSSNSGTFPEKWWVETEEDLKVARWIEEHRNWKWDEAEYKRITAIWGEERGLPTVLFPRVSVQNLYLDLMGVENATYALYDFTEEVEKYFQVLSESHERLIAMLNRSPIEIVNFGDNFHAGTLSPTLFEKYVLPEYQKRNDLLHQAGKFTHSHWDGDVKSLLPYAQDCGLDGIEAITPKPQGDVTLQEVKKALGDKIFLIDGIAAILFEDIFPIEMLRNQVEEAIELFAPKLILGISDEISSQGDLMRIRYVGDMVDDYNATCK